MKKYNIYFLPVINSLFLLFSFFYYNYYWYPEVANYFKGSYEFKRLINHIYLIGFFIFIGFLSLIIYFFNSIVIKETIRKSKLFFYFMILFFSTFIILNFYETFLQVNNLYNIKNFSIKKIDYYFCKYYISNSFLVLMISFISLSYKENRKYCFQHASIIGALGFLLQRDPTSNIVGIFLISISNAILLFIEKEFSKRIQFASF